MIVVISLFDLTVNVNVGATKAFRKSFRGHPQASLPDHPRVTARSTKFRKKPCKFVCAGVAYGDFKWLSIDHYQKPPHSDQSRNSFELSFNLELVWI